MSIENVMMISERCIEHNKTRRPPMRLNIIIKRIPGRQPVCATILPRKG